MVSSAETVASSTKVGRLRVELCLGSLCVGKLSDDSGFIDDVAGHLGRVEREIVLRQLASSGEEVAQGSGMSWL